MLGSSGPSLIKITCYHMRKYFQFPQKKRNTRHPHSNIRSLQNTTFNGSSKRVQKMTVLRTTTKVFQLLILFHGRIFHFHARIFFFCWTKMFNCALFRICNIDSRRCHWFMNYILFLQVRQNE